MSPPGSPKGTSPRQGGSPVSTWILLRGLTRGGRHWARFPEALQRRLPDARIVALDLPGNGALHDRSSPTRIGAMTDACRAQAAALGLPPPYRLVAVSMGAMVAIDWATRDPAAIAGCVLVNTSMRPHDPFHWRLRWRALVAGRALLLPWASARAREAAVLRMTSRNDDAALDVLDGWTALRRSQPVTTTNVARQLLAAARFRAPPTAPPVPLLVLASARDGLVDVRCSRGLAARWDTACAEHPAAGHDLTLDDPAWASAHIARWHDATSA